MHLISYLLHFSLLYVVYGSIASLAFDSFYLSMCACSDVREPLDRLCKQPPRQQIPLSARWRARLAQMRALVLSARANTKECALLHLADLASFEIPGKKSTFVLVFSLVIL